MLKKNSLQPPIAKKVHHTHLEHGHARIDPYFWLRDDERKNEEILQHLVAENQYTEDSLARLKETRTALFQEITARIQPDDEDVPVFYDGYWHYGRFLAGMEHPLHCRKKGQLDAPEEIILDENKRAQDHEYYETAAVSTTRDGRFLAFSEDTQSRRIYDVYLQDLEKNEFVDETITGTTGNLAWSNDGSILFYGKLDPKTLRAYQIWRHKMGTPVCEDILVFQEDDEAFSTSIWRSKSDAYMIIHSGATLCDEYHIIDAKSPTNAAKVFLPRQNEHEHDVMHAGEYFYILTNDKAKNSRLMRCTVADTAHPERWQEIIAHRDEVLLEDAEVFKDFLVLSEEKNANTVLRVIPWTELKHSSSAEHLGHEIASDEPCFSTWLGSNPSFDSNTLRFAYTSLTTPSTVYDYEMQTRKKTFRKQQPIVGDFDARNYISERIEIRAQDGTPIPVSLVYHKKTSPNIEHPLYLYAYGSYGASSNPYFSSSRLSLLDRGMIYAIAHIRGGQEKGRNWYDDGKMMQKMNTFTDFIDVAEGLQKQGRTRKDLTVAMGGSAGGLLMGVIANQAPKTFAAIVAYVPFVDVVTTMLDETIPLTTFEYDEWGNPNEVAAFEYMLKYSPYDNIKAQYYPPILVITGLHDSQVQYWEPAKWVAKLREQKLGDAPLYLMTDLDAGHGGASGRFKQYEDTALEFAFLFDLLHLTNH